MEMDCRYAINIGMWDKKVVLYGIGRLFERFRDNLNWDNIVAIVDADVNKQGKYIGGIKIESPENIGFYKYDFIVIFTDLYFDSAKINLIGNFFVEEQKIVSWRIFFDIEVINQEVLDNALNDRMLLYNEYLGSKTVKCVLDIGEQHLEKIFMTNETFVPEIDNLGRPMFKLHRNFYNKCYDEYDEIEKQYDILFIWGNFRRNIQWSRLLESAKEIMIWTIPYSHIVHKDYLEQIDRLQKWGQKQTYIFSDAVVYIFNRNRQKRAINCDIFVVTHKKYNVLADGIYKPICVGNQFENQSFYTEHSGDNISHLNDRLNECTALYWIWKNTNCEYVGLNHYRRYFYNNRVKNCANYLKEEKINEIFEDGYDFILPVMKRLSLSVWENITQSIGQELGSQALKIVSSLLEERQPEYIKAFQYVMSATTFYRCQMFVTRRKLLEAYCSWLFSFLIEAAERLDVSDRDAHHKRAMGYFAETMLTVWLLEQDVKVKELPIKEI